jgi:hypothetical protein
VAVDSGMLNLSVIITGSPSAPLLSRRMDQTSLDDSRTCVELA